PAPRRRHRSSSEGIGAGGIRVGAPGMTQIDDPWHMLSEEECMFCDVLERLCADKIAPLAAETDETSRFVHEQLATLGGAGMMGANLPEAYGGGGISAPALLRAVSTVAGACGSTASALTAH